MRIKCCTIPCAVPSEVEYDTSKDDSIGVSNVTHTSASPMFSGTVLSGELKLGTAYNITIITCSEMYYTVPSSSTIVTVEVVGVAGSIPFGGSNRTMKVSSPSSAIGSSVTTKSTQANVAPAVNEAILVSGTKSLLPALKGIKISRIFTEIIICN